MTTYSEQNATQITTTIPSVEVLSTSEVSVNTLSVTELTISDLVTTIISDPQQSFGGGERLYSEGIYNTGTYGGTTNIYS
ncbi:hypothetical protein [uncultured Mediterranean phage uvMED]|nr:hypothetical protein [uncultured Mediterranean phage uvMED]